MGWIDNEITNSRWLSRTLIYVLLVPWLIGLHTLHLYTSWYKPEQILFVNVSVSFSM